MREPIPVISDSVDSVASYPVSNWRLAMGLMIAALVVLLGIYHETFESMLDIWWRSETFAHGFLIFPISIWLIWRRRQVLARIAPRPDYRAVPMFALMGLGWLVARVSDVLVVEQLALIGMIPLLVWMLLGWRVAGELLFPLVFLFFSVPMGEFLIPPLMGFTADFTVKMLQITGIPVFREGTFFSIPSGDWSVVEACSGLRYLIASITLGFLYAYLSYASMSRRLAFMVLAVAFPVVANGLRAYMIVIIGHLSGMKLAVGVDHLIYGWVFFGLVMLFMFWIGSFWADTEQLALPNRLAHQSTEPSADGRAFGVCLLGALALAVVWPVRAAYIEQASEAARAPVMLALPDGAGAWRTADSLTEWEPYYIGADAKAKQAYRDGSNVVALYVMYYRHQQQGAELISTQNILIPQGHSFWRMPEEIPVNIRLNDESVTVLQGRLHSPNQRLLTWRWNRIGESYTANDYFGKFLEAKNKVLGIPSDGAAIIIAIEYGDNLELAASVLQRFVDSMLPTLEQSLNRTAGIR